MIISDLLVKCCKKTEEKWKFMTSLQNLLKYGFICKKKRKCKNVKARGFICKIIKNVKSKKIEGLVE